MTEIERKALALVNEVRAEAGHSVLTEHNPGVSYGCCWETLCRAIEQHEAFRKAVSDALLRYHAPSHVPHGLQDFIITKPDPLVEVAEELRETYCATGADWAKATRAALAKRGLEIREIEG